MSPVTYDDIVELHHRCKLIEKSIYKIRDRILNIKPNNELFIKIMRKQQKIDEMEAKNE